MKHILVSMLLFFLIFCLSPSAVAVNLQFLKDRPISYMSEEAFEEFKTKLIHALDTEADGYVFNWSNPEEDSSARVVFLNTYSLDAGTCRKIKTELHVNNRDGRSILHICKDEAWQLRASPISQFSDVAWEILSREVDYTLAEVADGVPNSWIIPVSGITGTLVPVKSEFTDHGLCRHVSVSIHFNTGELVDDVVRFCREPDGNWKRRSEWRDQE